MSLSINNSLSPSLDLYARPAATSSSSFPTRVCVPAEPSNTLASACVSGRLCLLLLWPELVHGEVLLQGWRWRWRGASGTRPAAAGEAAVSCDRCWPRWRRRWRFWRRCWRRKRSGEDENISPIQVGEESRSRREGIRVKESMEKFCRPQSSLGGEQAF